MTCSNICHQKSSLMSSHDSLFEVACCKCVCKAWLRLLETDVFVRTHHSKSVPALLIYEEDNEPLNSYKVFDLEDGPDHQSHELQCRLVTNFNLPDHRSVYGRRLMYGSSDGFVFLHDRNINPRQIYICNPITRDCIEVHCPQELKYSTLNGPYPFCVTYGFGTSKLTGQHKVVRISQGRKADGLQSECQVYTLGTGSWRTIAPGPIFDYWDQMAFLDGSLHWLVFDSKKKPWISCFNLETELFSTLSTPKQSDEGFFRHVYAVGDSLYLYEDTYDGRIFFWVMKEYGVDKSWTKEIFILRRAFTCLTSENHVVPCPLKVCRDGGILIALQFIGVDIFHCSKKGSIVHKIDISEPDTDLLDAILYTPSFLSLKSFVKEKVCSF